MCVPQPRCAEGNNILLREVCHTKSVCLTVSTDWQQSGIFRWNPSSGVMDQLSQAHTPAPSAFTPAPSVILLRLRQSFPSGSVKELTPASSEDAPAVNRSCLAPARPDLNDVDNTETTLRWPREHTMSMAFMKVGMIMR